MNRNTLAKRLELLKEIPMLQGLSETQLTQMVDDFRMREFVKDDIIFRQGDESKEVYFVLKGKGTYLQDQPGWRRNVH